MHEFLQRMLREKKTIDLQGRELEVSGGISEYEAQFLIRLIGERQPRVCLETGVAYGVSSLAICQALSRLPGERKHFGIDPNQSRDYGGAALAALQQCGCAQVFQLLEGPSHVMLPRLLEQGTKLDLALVDGWHTFDYTLLDVFYADKMLRQGGILLVHDMLHLPSKRKVWNFLRTHRRYRRLAGPTRPALRCVLSMGKAALLFRPGAIRLAIQELLGRGNLLVAEKLEDWEPNYDYVTVQVVTLPCARFPASPWRGATKEQGPHAGQRHTRG